MATYPGSAASSAELPSVGDVLEFETTLSGAVSSGTVAPFTLNVATTTGAPSAGVIVVGASGSREVMRYDSKTATSFNIVERGIGGSPLNHSSSDPVIITPVPTIDDRVKAEIIAIEEALLNGLDHRVVIDQVQASSTEQAVLQVGGATAVGGNILGMFQGAHTNLWLQEINSDDFLLINNAYFDGTNWQQPEGTAPAALLFIASGGRGFGFWTGDAVGGDGTDFPASGGQLHMIIAGHKSGRVAITKVTGLGASGSTVLPDEQGLTIMRDGTGSPRWLEFQGESNNNVQGRLGLDTAAKTMRIEAQEVGVAHKPVLISRAGGVVGIGAIDDPQATLHVVAHSAGQVGVQIQGATSQTANLLEALAASAVQFAVAADGNVICKGNVEAEGSLVADSDNDPAASGTVRLPNDVWVAGRNAANSGDVNILRVTAADRVELGASTHIEAATTSTVPILSLDDGSTKVGRAGLELVINDDSAIRLTDVPDRFFVEITGGDVNQSARLFIDLGNPSQAIAVAGLQGGNVDISAGNSVRTGTDGGDNTLNIGASSAGLDLENRLGAQVTFRVTISNGQGAGP